MFRSVLLFLFSQSRCAAQATPHTLPQEPKPVIRAPHFNRKAFIAEVSALAASQTADAISTRRSLDLPGNRGSELNPLFGPHPSPAKQAGINAAIFAGEAGLLYATEHNRHAWVRWAGRAYIGFSILEHSYLAACNAGPRGCKLQTF